MVSVEIPNVGLLELGIPAALHPHKLSTTIKEFDVITTVTVFLAHLDMEAVRTCISCGKNSMKLKLKSNMSASWVFPNSKLISVDLPLGTERSTVTMVWEINGFPIEES